jgi:nifR3 family TIM-barrel protein
MWITDILSQNKPIYGVAPMADMTDSSFCQTIREIGGADVVFREMVSSEAVVRDNEKTLGMTDFVPIERPIVQQIFGADPLTMARAAEIVMEHAGPEGIDINMGCPVYKITSNFNGAALMKDPDLAARIVREMKAAIGNTPLSVKIRLGWDNPDTFKTFIPKMEEAGANLISMHGRTKEQAYSGASDWGRIAEAAKIATVPFLANGDIHEPYQVRQCLEQTGADGVMIGRGVLGNPWFFRHVIDGTEFVSRVDRVAGIRRHVTHHIAQYGEEFGMKTFRKHISWYLKTNKIGEEVEGIKELRGRAVRVQTFAELDVVLEDFLIL